MNTLRLHRTIYISTFLSLGVFLLTAVSRRCGTWEVVWKTVSNWKAGGLDETCRPEGSCPVTFCRMCSVVGIVCDTLVSRIWWVRDVVIALGGVAVVVVVSMLTGAASWASFELRRITRIEHDTWQNAAQACHWIEFSWTTSSRFTVQLALYDPIRIWNFYLKSLCHNRHDDRNNVRTSLANT